MVSTRFIHIIFRQTLRRQVISVLACSACHIYPNYSYRQAGANSVDPDQTPQNAASDQDLHCLPFVQQVLSTLNGDKTELFIVRR